MLSQDFQGKAYYMSKIAIDKSWMENPRYASRASYMKDMICLLYTSDAADD